MKHALNAPSWFDVMAPDLEGARKFYGPLFGWEFHDSGEAMGHYTMCLLDGKAAAGMGPRPPGGPTNGAWTMYFNVADISATAAAIAAHGGTIAMGPMAVAEQGHMAIAVDPTGAAFGLWQSGEHTGAGVKSQHGAMGWQEAHGVDGPRARDFYASVFGFEPVPVPGIEYWIMQQGDAQLCGVMQDLHMPPGVPPHWLVYFDVRDADAAVAQIAATGGKVYTPPFDTPHGRMALVADPFGAVFAIIQPPTA